MKSPARAWRHWRLRRLIATSGAFDRGCYFAANPDVAAAGVNALDHYIGAGDREGRRPNPIFDPDWYRTTYLGGDARRNSLADYLRHARSVEARNPNRWFDINHYRSEAGISTRVDPMRHYLAAGRDATDPSPDFDFDELRRRFPDLGGHATPLAFLLNDYRVAGRIDACTSYYVSGWASRRAGPRIEIIVMVNGREQGRVVPWIARDDIRSVLDNGALGFFFSFPTRLASGDKVELRDDLGETIVGCRTTYRVRPLGDSDALYENRASIAAGFLFGSGVEIGAFTQPTDLPPDRHVTFFDRFGPARLRTIYNESWCRPLIEPDVVGEAATLEGLADAGYDFLIANHVLEHLEDAIGFLGRVADKLKAGGRAMIAVPDMRYGDDRIRALTPFEHLVADHEQGPECSRFDHYLEDAAIKGLAGDAALAHARKIAADTTLVHYHVWDAPHFLAFVDAAIAQYALPLKRVHDSASVHEIIVVLEKS